MYMYMTFLDLSLPRIITLPYTHKDQIGDYTMLAGDIVYFAKATDKRSGAVRATNVVLHKLIESQRQPKDRETVRDFFFRCLYTPTQFPFLPPYLPPSLPSSLPPSLSLPPPLPLPLPLPLRV